MAKGTALEKFFVSLGFEVDHKEAEEVEETLEHIKHVIETVVVAWGIEKIGEMFSEVAKEMHALNDFALLNDVAVDSVEALGYAAQLNGSSMEAATSSIQGLNRVLGEASLGIGRGAMVFKKLGLSAKDSTGHVKSFDEMLAEVADRMQGMSKAEAIGMATKLGMDPSMVVTLQQGAEALAKYKEEYETFEIPEGRGKVSEYENSLVRVAKLIELLKQRVVVMLAPVLTSITEKARKWMLANADIIKQGVDRFAEKLATVLELTSKAFGFALHAAMRLYTFFEQHRAAIWGLIGALLILKGPSMYQGFVSIAGNVVKAASAIWSRLIPALTAMNIELLPIPLILAAIGAAIWLVVDDFMTWQDGGDSVIGRFFEKFPFMLDFFNDLSGIVKDVARLIWDIGSAIFDASVAFAQELAPIAMPILRFLFDILGWIARTIGEVIVEDLRSMARVIHLVREAADKMVTAFEATWTRVKDAITEAKKELHDFITMIPGAQWVLDKVSSIANSATGSSLAQGLGDSLKQGVSMAMNPVGPLSGAFGGYDVSTLGAQTIAGNTGGGGVTVQDNSQHQTEIRIDGAQSPEKTADAVSKALDQRDRERVRQNQASGVSH